MYETAKLLYSTKKDYPKRSSPALIHEMRYIDQLGIATFEGTPAQFSTYSATLQNPLVPPFEKISSSRSQSGGGTIQFPE
jgi:hypothetical protein